jgi:hypothetical protein
MRSHPNQVGTTDSFWRACHPPIRIPVPRVKTAKNDPQPWKDSNPEETPANPKERRRMAVVVNRIRLRIGI